MPALIGTMQCPVLINGLMTLNKTKVMFLEFAVVTF